MISDLRQPDALELMRLGVDYRFTLKLRQFETLARPLSVAEQTEVAARVVAHIKTIPEDRRNKIEEDTAKAKVILEFATSFPGAQVPGLTQMLLGQMTPGELMYLWKQYEAGVEKVNPNLETMTQKELEQMVEALKKNYAEERREQLTTLSFWQLVDLCQLLTQGE
jgi:hypothetical protein